MLVSMRLATLALSTGVIALVGCGSGGDGSPVETANEGVFAVTSWTLDEGCDGGEVDVSADNPPLLGVGNQVILGAAAVLVAACPDDSACAARLEPDYVGPIDARFTFTSGDDTSGYGGLTLTATSTVDGCEGERADHRLSFDGEVLQIDSDSTGAVPTEADGDGFCTTAAADEATAGTPCAARQVITAGPS
jgi:hypothetical protein